MTISGLLTDADARLAAAGVEEWRLDSRLLLAWALGCRREDLVREPKRVVAEQDAQKFEAAVARRAAREPLPYITGVQSFYGRDFAVTNAVLIPRPDTETLIKAVLKRLEVTPSPRIIDVGTGSGCIAVTIACERPDVQVLATDLSTDALDIARRNAIRHGVDDRVTFVHADLLRPLAHVGYPTTPPSTETRNERRNMDLLKFGPVDAVVSNPPYISLGEMGGLQTEVREYEPRLALSGDGVSTGVDGAALYPPLFRDAAVMLAKNAWMIVEVGQGQADAVSAAARAAGYMNIEYSFDLGNVPRVVCAMCGAE